MRRSARSENTVYRTRRFIAVVLSVILASGALCLTASALSTPSSVVSELVQPVPVIEGVDRHYFMIMQYDTSSSTAVTLRGTTILVDYHLVFQSEPSLQFSTYGGWGGMHIISTVPFTATVSQTNVVTGSLLGSNNYSSSSNQYFPGKYLVSSSTIPDFNHLTGYYFIDDTVTSMPSQSSPFVTFSPPVPEQIQYQSYLPQPIWDQHNRYVVVNDRLYWISFYINSAYIQQEVIENNSNVYQQSGQGTEDGTYLDLSTSAYFYYHASESITYNGLAYYPVSLQEMDISFEDMIAPCLISGSTWRLSFDTDFFADYFNTQNDFLLDYRIYVSSFDLVSGEYIESVYSENTQLNNQNININIGLPEEVSSIYCYGVNFINRSNLPVNLSSIVWSYDFAFASWRDDMYSKLDAIYNLLSQSSVPSTTAPVDYASLLDPEPTVSGYDAEDAGSLLAGAVSDVNVELGDGMEWGRNQINDFATGVPELFLVLILALAFGLTILILGKKKSDN